MFRSIGDMVYRYMVYFGFFSILGVFFNLNWRGSLRCEGPSSFMAFVSLFSVYFNGMFRLSAIVGMTLGCGRLGLWTRGMAQSIFSLVIIFLYRSIKRTLNLQGCVVFLIATAFGLTFLIVSGRLVS